MAKRSEFADFLIELLSPLGSVTVRSMFGGYGVYLHGAMFGLVASDTLYLKADDHNRATFEAAGMSPFIYQGKNKPVAMSYYEVPPDALEDTEILMPWARSAIEAAARTKASKRPRRKRK